MIRTPNPNRELDRDPYWNFDEAALTPIVRIRQRAEYFQQTIDQCPNCGANCWEAEQPPIVFRGCACATMAFPPQTPLHDHWEANLWAKTVSEARKELPQQLKRELPTAAGGAN